MTHWVSVGSSPSRSSKTLTKTGMMKRSMKIRTSVAKLITTAG